MFFILIAPVLAVVGPIVGVLGKVGSKIGGFFKKIFGGKKKRKAARLAQKQQRIEDASNKVLAIKIAKLEQQANVGIAKAGVKLARVEKQLARQGISFDPGVQDASLSDLKFNIPDLFDKRRAPQVFQQPALVQTQFANGVPLAAAVPGFNLQAFFSKPMNLLIVGIGILLLFGRRLFK